jgi:hypothetical protein
MTDSETRTKTEYLFTAAEAKTFLRKLKGAAYFLSLNWNLPTVDADGQADGNCFPDMPGNVTVGREVATKIVADMLRHFEHRGGRVRLTHYTDGEYQSVFIG